MSSLEDEVLDPLFGGTYLGIQGSCVSSAQAVLEVTSSLWRDR